MSETDFAVKKNEGNASVVLNRPPALNKEQIDTLAAIVGKENVALDDYSRVKYSSARPPRKCWNSAGGSFVKFPMLSCIRAISTMCKKSWNTAIKSAFPLQYFSGGSSVNFGCRPYKGGVSLVMSTHMNKLLEINEQNQTCGRAAGHVRPGL